jgi:hypothetical protein
MPEMKKKDMNQIIKTLNMISEQRWTVEKNRENQFCEFKGDDH